jgi:hypothetical protein
MKVFRLTPVLLLAASVTANARTPQPSLYVSVEVAGTQADFQNVDAANGYVLTAGYNQPSGHFGVEASVMKLGKAQIDGSNVSYELGGYRGLIVFNSNFDTSTPMNIHLKGGVYAMNNELAGNDGTVFYAAEADSTGFVYSVGLEFYVAPNIALGGDLTSYTNVDYVADEQDATSLGLAARVMF